MHFWTPIETVWTPCESWDLKIILIYVKSLITITTDLSLSLEGSTSVCQDIGYDITNRNVLKYVYKIRYLRVYS